VFERIIERDRMIALGGVIGLTALAWTYIVYLARDMGNMVMGPGMTVEMTMPQMQSWGAIDFALMLVMWAVMMVAMMTPSAAPMLLVFANVNRRRHHELRGTFVPTGTFLLGYLVVWTGFSALATLAQWGLHAAALISPEMVSTSPLLGGVLLVAAGVFQWTPLKHACLAHCRSPLGFIMSEWREGTRGALVMGLKHGAYCVGCCWFLMGLLFVAGVMNLLWVAIIAAFVLIEKVASEGQWVSRAAGLLLIGWGVWMAAGVFI
jgi:predicted metal-binding membrane protein